MTPLQIPTYVFYICTCFVHVVSFFHWYCCYQQLSFFDPRWFRCLFSQSYNQLISPFFLFVHQVPTHRAHCPPGMRSPPPTRPEVARSNCGSSCSNFCPTPRTPVASPGKEPTVNSSSQTPMRSLDAGERERTSPT